MSSFGDHLESIAHTIADYRGGKIVRLSADQVERWVRQFDEKYREPLLVEMDHVLKRTYISKSNVEKFLAGLVKNDKLTNNNPASFWPSAAFLNIQTRGGSQHEMLEMFAQTLQQQLGYKLSDCGKKAPSCYVYIDDGLFTGITIISGLKKWLESDAPASADVHVIVIALHRGGQYYAEGELQKAAKQLGKNIRFKWWRIIELEDRRTYINETDVLRPTQIPDDARTQAYSKTLKFQPALRKPGNVGALGIFSSESGRNLLEQQFLIKGAYIREICPRLPKYDRPLGNMVLETLGFGSTIVTFRNCPNNAPLALWAGDPWYPLFPRKTN